MRGVEQLQDFQTKKPEERPPQAEEKERPRTHEQSAQWKDNQGWQDNQKIIDITAELAKEPPPTEEERRAMAKGWDEYRRLKQRGGLSWPEYLARHPEIDPDLHTADGEFIPNLPTWKYLLYMARNDLKALLKIAIEALLPPPDPHHERKK